MNSHLNYFITAKEQKYGCLHCSSTNLNTWDGKLLTIFNGSLSLTDHSVSEIKLFFTPMKTDLAQILSLTSLLLIYHPVLSGVSKDKHLFPPVFSSFFPLGAGAFIQWVRFQACAWANFPNPQSRVSVD